MIPDWTIVYLFMLAVQIGVFVATLALASRIRRDLRSHAAKDRVLLDGLRLHGDRLQASEEATEALRDEIVMTAQRGREHLDA